MVNNWRSRLARPDNARRDLVVGVASLILMEVLIARKAPDPGQRGADALAYVLALPLTLPFAVHRRWPLGSIAVMLASFGAFAALNYAVYPGLPVFAIVFGIAAHTDRRRSRLALVLSVATMIAGLSIQPSGVVGSSDWTSSLLALAVAWLAGENLRSRRARWAALEERAAMLEIEREERDRRAVADERLRIARDLHDVVAHAMSVIAVQAGAGHHLIDSNPEAARRALSNMETASRSALVEMRRLLGVLREDGDAPATRVPTPGLSKLGELLGRVRDAGLGVSLNVDGSIDDLPGSIELAAYRLVQEALTNVLKHGGPVATVAIRCTQSDLFIEITDEGGTPDRIAAPGGAHGHGLIGMRERVAVYDGDFSAAPRPGGGFRVAARLPLGRLQSIDEQPASTGSSA